MQAAVPRRPRDQWISHRVVDCWHQARKVTTWQRPNSDAGRCHGQTPDWRSTVGWHAKSQQRVRGSPCSSSSDEPTSPREKQRHVSRDSCNLCGGHRRYGRHNWPNYGTKCQACGRAAHRKVVCNPHTRNQRRSGSRSIWRQASVVRQVQTSPLDDHFERLPFHTVHIKEDSCDEVFKSLKENVVLRRTFRRMYHGLLDVNGCPAVQQFWRHIMVWSGGFSVWASTSRMRRWILCRRYARPSDYRPVVMQSPELSDHDLWGERQYFPEHSHQLQGSCVQGVRWQIWRDWHLRRNLPYHDRRKCDTSCACTETMFDTSPWGNKEVTRQHGRFEGDNQVTKPTNWVSNLVSNGRVWVCLDPKDLNKAMKRPHCTTPGWDVPQIG